MSTNKDGLGLSDYMYKGQTSKPKLTGSNSGVSLYRGTHETKAGFDDEQGDRDVLAVAAEMHQDDRNLQLDWKDESEDARMARMLDEHFKAEAAIAAKQRNSRSVQRKRPKQQMRASNANSNANANSNSVLDEDDLILRARLESLTDVVRTDQKAVQDKEPEKAQPKISQQEREANIRKNMQRRKDQKDPEAVKRAALEDLERLYAKREKLQGLIRNAEEGEETGLIEQQEALSKKIKALEVKAGVEPQSAALLSNPKILGSDQSLAQMNSPESDQMSLTSYTSYTRKSQRPVKEKVSVQDDVAQSAFDVQESPKAETKADVLSKSKTSISARPASPAARGNLSAVNNASSDEFLNRPGANKKAMMLSVNAQVNEVRSLLGDKAEPTNAVGVQQAKVKESKRDDKAKAPAKATPSRLQLPKPTQQLQKQHTASKILFSADRKQDNEALAALGWFDDSNSAANANSSVAGSDNSVERPYQVEGGLARGVANANQASNPIFRANNAALSVAYPMAMMPIQLQGPGTRPVIFSVKRDSLKDDAGSEQPTAAVATTGETKNDASVKPSAKQSQEEQLKAMRERHKAKLLNNEMQAKFQKRENGAGDDESSKPAAQKQAPAKKK